jgi:hypothetical protein
MEIFSFRSLVRRHTIPNFAAERMEGGSGARQKSMHRRSFRGQKTSFWLFLYGGISQMNAVVIQLYRRLLRVTERC